MRTAQLRQVDLNFLVVFTVLVDGAKRLSCYKQACCLANPIRSARHRGLVVLLVHQMFTVEPALLQTAANVVDHFFQATEIDIEIGAAA